MHRPWQSSRLALSSPSSSLQPLVERPGVSSSSRQMSRSLLPVRWLPQGGSLAKDLSELFRHLLDQVRSAVKLSRSRLQEFDTPDAIALGDDDSLMRVEGGIEVHLAWWHHPDDSAEDGHLRTQ